MIRRGAKAKVQLAGHYTVPEFGCGTDCSAFCIVDSVSGRVYDGFSIVELPISWSQEHPDQPLLHIEFHDSSRLIKVNGCPNEHDCGYYDYLMVDGKGLKLLDRWLLPKEYQE